MIILGNNKGWTEILEIAILFLVSKFPAFINETIEGVYQPSWRSWLARQSHNLKVVSSSLTEGSFC